VPIAVTVVLLLATVACSTHLKKPLQQGRVNSAESVVCVGEEPAMLAQAPTSHSRIEVRSSYVLHTNTVTYKEGVDYLVDRQSGSIRRTPDSKIPDFRKNVLYAQEDFDHSKFPGFGNTSFFAYVTYETTQPKLWPVQATQTHLLPKSVAKLKAGGPFRIIAYGDSITAGGDATRSDLIFWMRWADALQMRHEHARIIAINGATGGDSTVQGLARLSAKVLTQRPDLVLVGFGMNDHNRGGVPIPQFQANLREIIQRVRADTGAEVVLFSAFPPNPKWKFGSHRMEAYAAATETVAAETGCAFADVYGNWLRVLERKKPEDILGNNINHPNDFGHGLYFEVLDGIGL
jgi:acyl-CoA thioesterase-1